MGIVVRAVAVKDSNVLQPENTPVGVAGVTSVVIPFNVTVFKVVLPENEPSAIVVIPPPTVRFVLAVLNAVLEIVIGFVVEGKLSVNVLLQPLNADAPIVAKFVLVAVNVAKAEQPENADGPIVVIPDPVVTDAKPVLFKNKLLGIVVLELAPLIVKFLPVLNALAEILVTLDGKLSVAKLLQPANADAPTDVILEPSVTVVKL